MREHSTGWLIPTMAGLAAAVVLVGMGVGVTGLGSTATEPDPSAGGATSEHPDRSELADYLGFGHDPVADERAFNADVEARERWIQECMADAGFDYHRLPPDPATVMTLDGEVRVGPAETDLSAQEANDRYVAELGVAKREEYWTAFHGMPTNEPGLTDKQLAEVDRDGDGIASYEETIGRGCLGRASRAIPGVFAAANALAPELKAMRAEVAETMAASGARAALVDCVRRQGVEATGRTVVTTIGSDAQLRSNPEIIDCVAAYRTAEAAARIGPENDFLAEHRALIEELGVPVP